MLTLDKVLDEISAHSLEEQEMIVEIAKKRLIDQKREEIRKASVQAEKDYREGKIKATSVGEMLDELDK